MAVSRGLFAPANFRIDVVPLMRGVPYGFIYITKIVGMPFNYVEEKQIGKGKKRGRDSQENVENEGASGVKIANY